MRKIAFIFFFLLTIFLLKATNYYSWAPTGTDVTLTSNWWSNTNGTGSHPSNFTTAGQIFYVQNGHNMTASASWTVSGSGSKVVIQSGGRITTGGYNHDLTLDIEANGTYEVTNTSYSRLNFGTLNPASNFILNNSDIIFQDDITYGNLIIQAGIADVRGSSNLVVNGTLTILSGGQFSGSGTEDQLDIRIANIYVNGGNFYGTGGSGAAVYYISGNVIVNSGYFFGTYGSGNSVFNISGNVNVNSGGWLYGCYRSTGDNPYSTWNVAGDFIINGGYYARVQTSGGCPSFNFTGYGKSVKFGTPTNASQCQHNIEFASGSYYILTGPIYLDANYQLYIRGTMDAGTNQICKFSSTDPSLKIYGYLKTASSGGLIGSSNTTFIMNNVSSLYLASGSTIEYNSSSAQSITPLSSYSYLLLTGAGTKNLANDCTVNNDITINSPLNIASGKILYLYGLMYGTSTLNGGYLYVQGTAATLNLVASSLQYLYINRSNGVALNGNLTVNNLNLVSGSLNIGSNTMTITGTLTGSGLSGTANSTLIVSGNDAQLNLEALTLSTLTVARANGCQINGDLNVYNVVNLETGQFSITNCTFTLYGYFNTTNGTLITDNNSTLVIAAGNSNVNLPPSFISVLTINRSSKTCYLTANTTVGTLNLNNGTLAIGAYLLQINTALNITNGVLLGSSNSSLTVSGSDIYVPALTLDTFKINNVTTYLAGNVTCETLVLNNGNLNLQNNAIIVNNNLSFSSGVTITGSASSTLTINGTGITSLQLPTLNLGNLFINRYAGALLTGNSQIQNSLHLVRGSVNTSDTLTFSHNATIYRQNGSLSGNLAYAGHINVKYEANNTIGAEIPSRPILDRLTLNPNVAISANRSFDVLQEVVMCSRSKLLLDVYVLNLGNNANINGEMGSLIIGKVAKADTFTSLNLVSCGLNILQGPPITSFSVDQQEIAQSLPLGQSINRTWSLNGSFSGTANVTFIWDSSADNGLDFEAQPAVVMMFNGTNWVPVGEPVNVSQMNPRQLTIHTTHFSEWTVTTLENSLPVVLSSFAAIPTQENYVLLNWVTESENNLAGFRILRNTKDDASSALDLNVFLSASNTSTQQKYSYLDEEVEAPAVYYYWLMAVELNGQIVLSDAISVTLNNNPGNNTSSEIETAFLNAFPNPFKSCLSIGVNHKQEGCLRVEVYDLAGRKIAVLADGVYQKGVINLSWTGKDLNGKKCSSGIYFVRCRSGENLRLVKVVLLK